VKPTSVVIYALNRWNGSWIRNALAERGITDVRNISVIPCGQQPDTTVDFVIMMFDEDFKDYDLECFTEQGYPDWSEEVAYEAISDEITAMHRHFPKAQLFLVDCVDFRIEDFIGISCVAPDDLCELYQRQIARENRVLYRIRERFFPTPYCVAKELRMSVHVEKEPGRSIAEIIGHVAGP